MHIYESEKKPKFLLAGSPLHSFLVPIFSGLGALAGIVGLFLYLPLLFGLAMSFDAPGSGKHWAHWAFVISNIMLGPLCVVSLVSRSRRHWSLYGFTLATFGWLILNFVCHDQFVCR